MLRKLFRKKHKKVNIDDFLDTDGLEIEEIESEKEKKIKDIRTEHVLAAFFTLNAIVVSILGSLILRVTVIAVRYYDRIAAIDNSYAAYVDAGTYLAGALFLYAVFNIIGAAYFLYEAKMGV